MAEENKQSDDDALDALLERTGARLERVGKPGGKLRERVQDEHLILFKNETALAQQIILDHPPALRIQTDC